MTVTGVLTKPRSFDTRFTVSVLPSSWNVATDYAVGVMAAGFFATFGIPLGDRPLVLAIIQEHHQRKQIQLLARQMREVHERVAPVWRIMRTAEQEDPDIASLVQEGLKGRLQGMSQFKVALHTNGSFREGLTMSLATETVWAIGSAEVYRLLTIDRGWSADKYEAWLTDTLSRCLLP